MLKVIYVLFSFLYFHYKYALLLQSEDTYTHNADINFLRISYKFQAERLQKSLFCLRFTC